MSIGSLASNTWTRHHPPQSGISSVGGANATPSGAGNCSSATASSSPAGTGTGTPASGITNLFQNLASDIQALLVQAQGGGTTQAATANGSGTTTPASGTTATGTTSATTTEQQLASDMQSLLAQLQGNQAGRRFDRRERDRRRDDRGFDRHTFGHQRVGFVLIGLGQRPSGIASTRCRYPASVPGL